MRNMRTNIFLQNNIPTKWTTYILLTCWIKSWVNWMIGPAFSIMPSFIAPINSSCMSNGNNSRFLFNKSTVTSSIWYPMQLATMAICIMCRGSRLNRVDRSWATPKKKESIVRKECEGSIILLLVSIKLQSKMGHKKSPGRSRENLAKFCRLQVISTEAKNCSVLNGDRNPESQIISP